MFDQVVFHARHELPHIAHRNMRTALLGLPGALDEVLNVLGKRGGFVGGQLQGVSPDGSAGVATISLPQSLQTWRS